MDGAPWRFGLPGCNDRASELFSSLVHPISSAGRLWMLLRVRASCAQLDCPLSLYLPAQELPCS